MKSPPVPEDETRTLAALGAAIRKMRKARGISQEELSYLCQIDRSHMGRIERGERNVSILNLARIAKGLASVPSEILRAAGL